MRLSMTIAALGMALSAAVPIGAPAASIGTCQTSATEIDIGSASSVMAGYDPLKGVPSLQTVPITVSWNITNLAKGGATVTVNLTSPTGTMLDPLTGTPLAYSIYYGSNNNGSLFGNGLGGTAHYSTVTTAATGHDIFQISAWIAPSQNVKTSHTPLSYSNATQQMQCSVS
jgi:hypothetical protein